MKVSIQGVAGSFHHIACEEIFGEADFLERGDFEDVFLDVKEQRADLGAVAIENSIAGSLIYNFDHLARFQLPIVGETYLRIVHNLIAAKGETLESIKEVWSHPMAIQQCRRFLKKYPFRIVEKDDTAGVIKELAQHPISGIAGIASTRAAELYGMNVLAESIETDPNNYTRFLLLSRQDKHLENQDDRIKSSLHFSFSDGAGTLVKVLSLFAALNINMTKIESRPRLGSPWEYEFFVDIRFDMRSLLGQELLYRLKQVTSFVHVLGCYPSYSKLHF